MKPSLVQARNFLLWWAVVPLRLARWTLVRATSVILFLGVGSFVCYKLFHRLKRKFLTKSQTSHWESQDLPSPFSTLIHISSKPENCSPAEDVALSEDEEFDLESLGSLFDDRVFELDPCPVDMGVGSSSSSSIPVYFSKTGGIQFNGDCIKSSPNIDIPHHHDTRHNNNIPLDPEDSDSLCESLSFDDNLWNRQQQQDAVSMMGNFSPGSLKEKYLKAGLSPLPLPMTAEGEESSPLSPHGSEISEILAELEEGGGGPVSTVTKFEHLQSDIQDVKQLMEELDAELVELQHYQQTAPAFGFQLTDIVTDCESPSSVVDVVSQHKARVKARGLMEEDHSETDSLRLLSGNSLPWDDLQVPPSSSANVSPRKTAEDSGSECGTSLDLDSRSTEPRPTSLEWDPSCLPEDDVFDSPAATTNSPLVQQIKQVIWQSASSRKSTAVSSPSSESSAEPLPSPVTDNLDSGGGDANQPLIGKVVNLNHFFLNENRDSAGLQELAASLGCTYIRPLRQDGSSLVRGVLAELLSTGSLLKPWGGSQALLQRVKEQCENHPWLLQTWAGESREDQLASVARCLEEVEQLEKHLDSSGEAAPRLRALCHHLSPALDISLGRLVRLLMALTAMRLHSQLMDHQPVPLFALVLFSGGAAPHLPSHGPLSQLEMFLLAHCLSIQLRVVRTHLAGTEDAVSHYSEGQTTPGTVTLVTADDIHFHLLQS